MFAAHLSGKKRIIFISIFLSVEAEDELIHALFIRIGTSASDKYIEKNENIMSLQ